MRDKVLSNDNVRNNVYSSLGENSLLPLFWLKRDGRIFHVNNAAIEHIGYEYNEIIDRNIIEIDPEICPEDINNMFEIVKEQKVLKIESKHIRKDGAVLDVEIVINYYKTDDTEFVLSYVFDITAKKEKERELFKKTRELEELNNNLERLVAERTAKLEEKIKEQEEVEKRLKASEDLFVNAFKTSKDSVNVNRLEDGTYLKINDGFMNILGYTREEVIGKSSLDLKIWRNPEDRARLVEGIKKNGYYDDLEAEFIHKDGHIITGLMSASVQEMDGEKVIVNVSKDITKLRFMEEELKQINKNLEQKVQEEILRRKNSEQMLYEQKKLADMGKMINAIAHQWRQPINALGLYAQEIALLYRESELTDDIINDFENVHMGLVTHLSETIDDFRSFFKPDKDVKEFEIIFEVINLIKLISVQFNTKNIQIVVSCKCDKKSVVCSKFEKYPECSFHKTKVKGYLGEFKQALVNLLYNASDSIEEAIEKKYIKSGKIEIFVEGGSDRTVLNISDNGMGIDSEIIGSIFDPYFTTKVDRNGTGLGLYMTKIVIEQHMKGRLTARNNEDRGAVFAIEIPAVIPG